MSTLFNLPVDSSALLKKSVLGSWLTPLALRGVGHGWLTSRGEVVEEFHVRRGATRMRVVPALPFPALPSSLKTTHPTPYFSVHPCTCILLARRTAQPFFVVHQAVSGDGDPAFASQGMPWSASKGSVHKKDRVATDFQLTCRLWCAAQEERAGFVPHPPCTSGRGSRMAHLTG